MGQRRDTGVARHTGGWIVLGTGLLAICLVGAWMSEPVAPTGEVAPRSPNGPGSSHDSHSFPELRIDINLADEAELSCVEGIGPALAHRIVEYRQRAGRFRTLAELDDVPGVGPQLVRRLQSAMQPLPDSPAVPESDVESDIESDVAVSDPARLVRRNIKLPSTNHLND